MNNFEFTFIKNRNHFNKIIFFILFFLFFNINSHSADNMNLNTNSITAKEIDNSLIFCRDYPVTLKYENQILQIKDNEVPPIIIKGHTLIPSRVLFEAMSNKVYWDNDRGEVKIENGSSYIILKINSIEAVVNGENKSLTIPPLIIDHDNDYYGSTMIPARFVSETLGYNVDWEESTRTISITKNTSSNNKISVDSNSEKTSEEIANPDYSKKVENTKNNFEIPTLKDSAKNKLLFLDIGHGGKDKGAIGHENMPDELTEKELNLKIGLCIKKYLEQSNVKFIMQRETDIFHDRWQRARDANQFKADLFVSIHNNANKSSIPRGSEVLYYDTNEKNNYGIKSSFLAKNIQNNLVSLLGTFNRGIIESPKIAVLNKTKMPAVVVEGAFLSNEDDFQNIIKKDDYVDKYSKAVVIGIINTLNDSY